MQTAQNAFGYQNQSCSGRRNQNACISNKRLQKQGLKFRNQIMMGFALGTRMKMYLAVLWICDKVVDADSGNGICIS